MKDEIKELLDDFKWYIEQKNIQDINGEYEYPRELTQDEAQILLDYITNLQEELEAYKKERKNILDKSKRLNYKTRIDKAIEYIDKNIIVKFNKLGYKTDTVAGIVVDDLLEILKGSDKE